MSTKLSKDNPAVDYRDDGGIAFKRCGKCSMYIEYGGCTLVRGFINSYGLCKKFERAPDRKVA